MNRAELVREIYKRKRTGLNQNQIDTVLLEIIDIIGDMPDYETLILQGLGTFHWKKTKEAKKFNTTTKEFYTAPATMRMKLRPSKKLVRKIY